LALRDLVRIETQLVYLTATMRPSEEGEFVKVMGLPPKEQCQWFRGVTTRKNIRYQVQQYEMTKEEEAVADVVAGLTQKYPMPGQIIVYCDTVAKTVQLARKLGCVCFHRNVGSHKEKAKLVQQLTEGRQQVFTATNALGLGVDAPTIRAVVHVGIVRKVRHYAQESGRAGRDGLASEAIIMRGVRVTQRGQVQVPTFKDDVEKDMQLFIGGEGCMRVVIDQAMDGRVDRIGCEEGEEPCQRCQAQQVISEVEAMVEDPRSEEEVSAEAQEGIPNLPEAQLEVERIEFEQQLLTRKARAVWLAQSQSREVVEVERLVQFMEEWKTGCQRCRAFGEPSEGHPMSDCSSKEADAIRQAVSVFKETVQWAPFSGCFECGLPQDICIRFEANIDKGGWRRREDGRCQYADVLAQAVFCIWVRYTQDFGDLIEGGMKQSGWVARTEREKEEGPQIEDIIAWFGKKVRWGGVESNQMCFVLCKFALERGI
jgi:superfamily II DNA helicase RecQ